MLGNSVSASLISGATARLIGSATAVDRPLSSSERSDTSSLTGGDETAIRIHEGRASRAAAMLLGARGFTLGSHIYLGEPSSPALIRHEVIHALQQRDADVSRPVVGIQSKMSGQETAARNGDAPDASDAGAQPMVARAEDPGGADVQELLRDPAVARRVKRAVERGRDVSSVLAEELAKSHRRARRSSSNAAQARSPKTPHPHPGNPGLLQGYVALNGVTYARYKATEGTWVSASLLDQGYAEASSRPAAYEPARAYARTVSGKPLADPDRLQVGQEFLIQSKNVTAVDFSDEPVPVTGYRLPMTKDAQDPFKLSTRDSMKHWFVDPHAWVNADSDTTDRYPSFELQGPAPPSDVKTPEDRGAYWLSLHKGEIIQAEGKWNVPREAIAGIIAWEALKNPQAWSVSSAGPGKMHLEEKGGWPQEIERSGRIAPTPDFMKKYDMRNPLTAIMYIGAGLDLVATISEKAGWDVRNDPELLGHIYHAYKPGQWKAKLSHKSKSEKFEIPPGGMGDWIKNNLPYLQGAVGRSNYGPQAP